MHTIIVSPDTAFAHTLSTRLSETSLPAEHECNSHRWPSLLRRAEPGVAVIDERAWKESAASIHDALIRPDSRIQGLVWVVSAPPADDADWRALNAALRERACRLRVVHRSGKQGADGSIPFLSFTIGELVREIEGGEENCSSSKRLRVEREKYRFFFDHMPIAAVVSDSAYTIQEWNVEAEQLFGYSKEEAIGSVLTQLLYSPENEVSPTDLKNNLLNTLVSKERSQNANYDRTKDGRDILCEWFDLPYSTNDGEEFILSVAKDVTKEKQMLDELSNTVEQKNLMMQEIHHRLKNNLTMITSLINMRMQEGVEEEALKDIQGKIRALSDLYEKMHREGETAEVELSSYIEDLLYALFTTLAKGPFEIRVEIESMYVQPELAIAFGLITNEIATNALKHGFSADDEAVFTARAEYDDETGEYRFTLSNTGNPFPESIDFGGGSTLGLQLIETLVTQLKGRIELVRRPSATYHITIPAESLDQTNPRSEKSTNR